MYSRDHYVQPSIQGLTLLNLHIYIAAWCISLLTPRDLGIYTLMRLTKIILFSVGILLVLTFLVPSLSLAKTYHVAKTGNDKNAGTIESPLLTISRGAELAGPGDTVLVHKGIYRERVAPPRGGEPNNRITYMAAPGERVLLKGSEEWNPNWRSVGDGVYTAKPVPALFNDLRDEYVDHHNPFKVELASTPWQREGLREVERGYDGDDSVVFTCGQIFVNGERFREVPLQDELEPGTWYFDTDTDHIVVHFGDQQPTKQFVELTTRRRIFAPASRGLGYITVQGFIMEHCGNQYPTNFWEVDENAQKGALGIEAGHHWIIRRNLIRHAKTFAIDAGYVDKRTPRDMIPHDNLIEENYVVQNGSAGILSNASVNMIIRNNVIMRNNVLRFFELKRWEQAGIKCHNLKNGLIEKNYISNNILTYGIWLDNQFPDSRVSKNVIANNGRAGIFLEMSDYDYDRLLVDNNIIVGNAENPVYIHDASGATFAHNLMANTVEQSTYGQGVFVRQVSARTKTYHHSLYNNILVGNSLVMDFNYPSHRGGPQQIDYNVYGCNAKERVFSINSSSDKPAPWNRNEFEGLLSSEIGRDVFGSPNGSATRALLSFAQWKDFWEVHGLHNDRCSTLVQGSTVSFDDQNQTLTIELVEDPDDFQTTGISGVESDFFGVPIPTRKRIRPGPFQELKSGTNSFSVWDGIPILGEGLLPAPSFNTGSSSNQSNSEALEVSSPDGRLRIEFSLQNRDSRNHVPVYQVWYDGKEVLSPSELGLEISDGSRYDRDMQVVETVFEARDATWRPIWGERNRVRDHHRELRVLLESSISSTPNIELTFRCYDEGLAFRYGFNGEVGQTLQISRELTQFSFLRDHPAWITETAQGIHTRRSIGELKDTVERPIVIRVESELYAAVAEAALVDYASMRLSNFPGRPHTLSCQLAGTVKASFPFETPWRVMMIGRSPGELLQNNDLFLNLNEPCAIVDTSWIKPGKVIRDFSLTTAGGLACVDFAEKHNIQYVEFDAGWYGHEFSDDSDATTISVDPERSPGPLDLLRVVRYAEEKNIGIILYVNRRALETQLDEILPLYKSWGIRGVKYGFVRTGSQQWTNWLHDAIRKAADHELMVDVHDEYRPTGFRRTYPNLMTVEGIGGDETSPTTEATIANAFVRSLAGPADSTFCYFDDRVVENSSHPFQLAKAVCIFSPWQVLYWYDVPPNRTKDPLEENVIAETPELEFWDHMPTTWHDTKVLHGSIGEYIVVVRRTDEEWFLGALNNGQARKLSTTLEFLEPNKNYLAKRYYHDPNVSTKTQVAIDVEHVNSTSILSLDLESNGGEAIHIIPVEKIETAELPSK